MVTADDKITAVLGQVEIIYMGQNAWTSLNIHYQRSGKFECESAHNKRRKG